VVPPESLPFRAGRFNTNLWIEPTERPEVYVVRSVFQLWRSRGVDPVPEMISGEREDRVRREAAGWKIAQRTIYPDQAVLPMQNLSMFL